MAATLDPLPLPSALIQAARDFYRRGWMAGTAGNLSARVDADQCWITASGLPKGSLQDADFLCVRISDGTVLEQRAAGRQPSAETIIHRTLYRLFPSARACFHVHSVDACIAADRASADAGGLPLPPLEMLKGFGIYEPAPQIALPLFANHLEVPDIAADIERRFGAQPPRLTALMIRDHGVTVWGDSLQQAYDRVEIIEFILSYIARR